MSTSSIIDRPRHLPRVGVGLLVVDDCARVLLTLRRRPPEAGCWSILGGRVEPFEPLEACAVREAWEEARVEIAIDRLLCVTDHIIPADHDHWVAPAYLGRVTAGVAVNAEPEKTSRVEWFALDALPAPLTITARNAVTTFLRCRFGAT